MHLRFKLIKLSVSDDKLLIEIPLCDDAVQRSVDPGRPARCDRPGLGPVWPATRARPFINYVAREQAQICHLPKRGKNKRAFYDLAL